MGKSGDIGVLVWLVLSLALAGCGRNGTSDPSCRDATCHVPTLSEIDSLMWQRPDTALTVLVGYLTNDTVPAITPEGRFAEHYAQLLASELLYKNDCVQTNRSELLSAVDYFDSLLTRSDNLAFLAARAHYIKGVGSYERDSVVDACREYLQALEIMEDRFDEKDLVGHKARFMALTYTHLCGLFSDQYLHEQAIHFGKESLAYYHKYNTPNWHVSWVLEEIGIHNEMMAQLDSAEYYYQSAIDILEDTVILMYRDITAHLICLEYKKDNRHFDTAIKGLHLLLRDSESDGERLMRIMYIGELYFYEQKYDSARVYLDKVFRESSVVEVRRQAAEWLVEIGKDADEYAYYLVPFANQEENKSEIKTQLTEAYKAFGQNRMEREHQKERKRQTIWVLAVIVGLLFVLSVVYLLYFMKKRNNRDLEKLIESERQAHKIQQAALAGRLKRSNAALKEQRDAKHTITHSSSSSNPKCVANSFMEEPVCQHILAVCNNPKNPMKSTVPASQYSAIALNDMQKAQLKNAADHHYGPLFKKLKEQYSELNEKDLLYCYLSLLGLSNVQISILLQYSMSTIGDREKRLKRILGSKDRVAVTLLGLSTN